jgi:hypothetical protein
MEYGVQPILELLVLLAVLVITAVARDYADICITPLLWVQDFQ